MGWGFSAIKSSLGGWIYKNSVLGVCTKCTKSEPGTCFVFWGGFDKTKRRGFLIRNEVFRGKFIKNIKDYSFYKNLAVFCTRKMIVDGLFLGGGPPPGGVP